MQIIRNIVWGLALAILIVSCDRQVAPPSTPWLASVAGQTITPGDLEEEIASLAAGEFIPEKENTEYLSFKRSVLKEMIRQKLLLIEARRRDIVLAPEEITEGIKEAYGSSRKERLKEVADKAGLTPERLIQRHSDRLLVEKLFRHDIYPRILIDEAEVLAAYERDKEEYLQAESVRVRQIVVASEEEAEAARRRLRRGESFADVARELSIMPEKDKGGDLGRVGRSQLPEPFSNMVFELPRNIFNRPVKSSYGYHIFYITDFKPENIPSQEKLLPIIRERMFTMKKTQAEKDLMDILKTRYKVEMNETGRQAEKRP